MFCFSQETSQCYNNSGRAGIALMTGNYLNDSAAQFAQIAFILDYSVLPLIREDLTRFCYESMDFHQRAYKKSIL